MNAGGARARTADASSRERRRRVGAVERKVKLVLIELCDGLYRGAPHLTWGGSVRVIHHTKTDFEMKLKGKPEDQSIP